MKPYQEQVIDNHTVIREFSENTHELDLVWHMDDEDRTIVALEETNWMFQFDDELPIPINSPIFIPKHKIHRVIKGDNNLKIKIMK